MALAAPLNIFSGALTPLGAALTNPTELSKQKGTLKKSYPVVYRGRRFPDAEAAYQLSKEHAVDNLDMMAEIIIAKFRQHPDLAAEVAACGGTAWLMTCSHLTNARTEGSKSWEGVGLQSKYIRILADAYERFTRGEQQTELGQGTLF